MNTLYLCHQDICLKVICEADIEVELREHFCGELIFSSQEPVPPAYTLFVGVPGPRDNCIYSKHFNEFFHGASMSCWISNMRHSCWIDDFSAPTHKDMMLCIRYYCSNVFNRLLELNGYIGIHSSCVAYKDIGVVFIGDRMAGKTTSMLTLIDSGFSLVCNDESAMKYDPQKDCIDVFGVHNDVYIRMREHLCQQKYGNKYLRLAAQQHVMIDSSAGLSENRIIVSHKLLAELNGVSLFPATHADLVILPKYCQGINRTRLLTVGEETCVQYLLGQETELIHDSAVFLYEMNLPHSTTAELPSLVRRLAQRRCYCCEYNEKTAQDFARQIKLLCKELLP